MKYTILFLFNLLSARNKVFILFSFCIICGCCIQVKSQEIFQPELSIGPFTGVTLSQVSFNPKIKQQYLIAYTVGCKLRLISEKHLGFLIEPNYSVYGWSENFEEYEDLAYKYSRKLHYIELPFMTHMYFGNKQRIFLNAGPIGRFLIGEKENINFSVENAPNPNSSETYGKPIEHKFDYGIAAGLGMELKTKKNSFLLEGRYYFGLGDIFNNHKKDFYPKSPNQNITITLTYLMPWGI